MYPTSAAYKQAIRGNIISDKVTGTITTAGGTISIDSSAGDIFDNSLYKSSSCVTGDGIEIGTANIGEMGMSLNIGGDPDSLVDAKAELIYHLETAPGIWEQVPLGTFWVDEASRRNRGGINIKAFDGMTAFDIPLTAPSAGTPSSWISILCAQAGVTLGTPAQDIADMANGTTTLYFPADSQIETCRDLLMWLCQHLGAFARMSRDNKLLITPVTSATPGYTIGYTEQYSGTYADGTVQIAALQYGDHIVGTEGITMSLDENPLWIGRENVSDLLSEILAQIGSIEYTPADLSYVGDPALDPGDIIIAESDPGKTVNLYLTSSTWWHYGKHNLQSAGKSAAQRKRYSQTQKAVSSIEKVLRLTKEIAETASGTANDINNAIGGNILIRQTPNERNEILIMDDPDPAKTVKIWRWNMGGLGYSDNVTGADNPLREYTVAITMSGAISADFITTGVLKAILIEAVEINCNDKFSVTPEGVVTAVSGTIGGWAMSETGLTAKDTPTNPEPDIYPDMDVVAGVAALGAEYMVYSDTSHSPGVYSVYCYTLAAKRKYTFENAPISGTITAYLTNIPPKTNARTKEFQEIMISEGYFPGQKIPDTNEWAYLVFCTDEEVDLVLVEHSPNGDTVGLLSGGDKKGESGFDINAKIPSPIGKSKIRFYAGEFKDGSAPFYVTESGYAKTKTIVSDTVASNFDNKTAALSKGEIIAFAGGRRITITPAKLLAEEWREYTDESGYYKIGELTFPLFGGRFAFDEIVQFKKVDSVYESGTGSVYVQPLFIGRDGILYADIDNEKVMYKNE